MGKKKSGKKNIFKQYFLAVPSKRVEDGTTEATATNEGEE